ncbi:hypothetical protein SmJEL517_g02101 [Synchytrium microbalum]|uniref:GB1/RHD3-type G domain-containing protein n=1 Tax=Synchytrium microbalum TaxID=1806994 RepID=A0A507C8D7_9FUNG|nr:uncharacterized protein SmJEL517_g02101 [Synchytrium microbalum]TPX35588.1 hypothetical protein SmJEL517_g02101 [Synchytrium microbalum]
MSIEAEVPDLVESEFDSDESPAVPDDLATLQVVDEHQQFTPELQEYMQDKWNLASCGFDYNLVAVFGSQSTGKSTLLNRLFNTTFAVMDEKRRQQTTKGIWLSPAHGKNLLVLDVEGTDGRERGEDQDFERKSALFSLAIAEVLIVNMWENMVGLYNGANMGLLKTVFEVNLQLFQAQGSPKTLLMFILRDYTAVTPIATLSKTLMQDLEKIWISLNKPAGHETSQISDFFDFAFEGLPHKVFTPEKFESAVATLKTRFYNNTGTNYIFGPSYHKHIPADGFPRYAESIWAKILTNRDLDLPTQQQLLAQYRCDEIGRGILETFVEATKSYRPRLDSGLVIDDMGHETETIIESCLASFDRDASRYNPDVYKRKRAEFLDKLTSILHINYMEQLRNLHKRGIVQFNKSLQAKLKGGDSEFASSLRACRQEAESTFRDMAVKSRVSFADWSYEEPVSQFLFELDEIATLKRNEALQRMVSGLQKLILDGLSDPIIVELNDMGPDMWSRISNTFQDTVKRTLEEVRVKSRGFEASDEEIETSVVEMQKQVWQVFHRKLVEETDPSRMLVRLKSFFEDKFRYDEKGLPRMWKPDDDIDGVFTKARNETDVLFSRFERISIEPDTLTDLVGPIDDSDLVLLSPSKLSSLRDRFLREVDASFLDAKRSIVSTTAKLPYWYLGLTLLLGWNELMAVLTNPIYFLSATTMVLVVVGMWYTGTLAPMLRIAQVASREVITQVAQYLRDSGLDGFPASDTQNNNSSSNSSSSNKSPFKTPRRTVVPKDNGEDEDDDIPLSPLRNRSPTPFKLNNPDVGLAGFPGGSAPSTPMGNVQKNRARANRWKDEDEDEKQE